ncbi:ATP-binding protein [Nocardioides sp. YIM 152315]|uniref:ATP-binding protein n=1 Tax=Nocardioides sp. YIM 152315 TaxID=3031760 RepID=UPI0023DC6C3F|nr:ATP-binding protein [Nocardioides sp. YIM 152315]MDF1603426.1 ATP-binding protein [Nocardioides sp. YIM 152315]
MSRARLPDLVAFAAYFVLAALLGRQTVLDGSEVALVWPAAGVAAAWFAVTGWRRWLVVDAVVLFVCSAGVNAATGADLGLAAGFAIGTVVQALVFGALLGHWCPGMWGFGDEPPPGVQSVRDLGLLASAAFLSAVAASLVGPTTILFLTDGTWDSLATWVLRNGLGILAIFPLSMLARNAVRARARAHSWLGRGGTVEAGLLAVVTALATWLVFWVNHDLPVPFLLVATCVWAGTRFTPWVSDVHAILVGGAATIATVLNEGPFTAVTDVSARELVFQSYLAVIVALNLTLSVARQELLLANHRLAQSRAESQEQATMLRTILDTMGDGVSVLDVDGRLVLRNRAAGQLVGDPQLDAGGRVPDRSAGFFYADGTPTSREEGLFAKALAGEKVEAVDVFVRNPAAPDGRMLEMTMRPLPETDPPLVVLVFHDVTADRRERDELASFAGVVAHDLLNPLTVVEGWSEALLEAAHAGTVVPPDQQVVQLDRILRAAQRMQHLISDLLAYTTARDLKIKPVRVDLGSVAADIARARVDAERVKGSATPAITVDPDLPSVLAEPVLLRQVIDNLVGNAVKYVAPDVTPQVRVTARQVADDGDRPMVLMEISDNGIGIPEDEQSRVFDTFHRAHADGGYRGTGLGLSIVKRIAERHGGTAWAGTNPTTGGTTMSVTFPAARVNGGPFPPPQEQ